MFKIAKIYSKRVMCFCPQHKSKRGTADLDVSLEGKYAGYFRCWGCGYSGKISTKELEELRNMRGEIKSTESVTDWNKFNSQCLKERLMVNPTCPFNFSPLTMAQLQWGWYEGTHTFPERDEKDNIIGVLRRWPDGNKGMIAGSKRGIYIPRIKFDPSQPLYITEGVSDLGVILECGLQGIGRSNCDHGKDIITSWMVKNDLEFAVIIADNDEAGIKGMKSMLECRGWDGKIPTYKDLREMYETVGKEETREWLLANI